MIPRMRTLKVSHEKIASAVSRLLFVYTEQQDHEKIVALLASHLEHDVRESPDHAALIRYYSRALIGCKRAPEAILLVCDELSRLEPGHPDHSTLQEHLELCLLVQEQQTKAAAAEGAHEVSFFGRLRRCLDWFSGLF